MKILRILPLSSLMSILQSRRVSESPPPSSELCPLLQEAAHGEHIWGDHWMKANKCFDSSAYPTKDSSDVCEMS